MNAGYTQVIKITDCNNDFNEFIEYIINKYDLKNSKSIKEIKYRNCKDSDDVMVQIIVDNRLIAIAICRRTDFNMEEYTCIDLQAIS